MTTRETKNTGDARNFVGSTEFTFSFSGARGKLDNFSSDNIDFWYLGTILPNQRLTVESEDLTFQDRQNYQRFQFDGSGSFSNLPVPHELSIWNSSGVEVATSFLGSVSYTNRSFQDLWVSVEHFGPMNGTSRGVFQHYAYDLSKSQVSVAPVNTAPVAFDDTATATAGQPVTITIGSNDSDANGDRLATTGLTGFFDAPRKGTVSYTDNFFTADTVTYTPFSTATGTDSFRYQVSDGKGGTDTARVTVTISSANRDPVALNDTATATAGVATTITIGSNDSDADGDRLTTTGLTGFFNGPSKGTVSYTDFILFADTVRYTPFSTATGTDSFRYQVSDGKGGTDTATVTVTITGANRDPVALNDTATARAGVATVISIGSNDSDPDNDSLTTSGVFGQGPSKGTVSYRDNFSSADTVTYTPFSTATGTDRFTYQVSDGKGGTDTATVTVTFANQVPVALNDTATATAGQAVTINIGANDSDADNDRLSTTGLTNPSQGTVSYRDNTFSADTATYTPFSTATGTDRFTYQVSDGKGGTDTATVTVTITASDLAGDTSTTGRINIGESVVGTHESGDFRDWYAVSLIGGKTYIIDLEGTSTGAGTLSDPIVEVFTGFSAFNTGFDNNSGIGTNAKLSFTPTSSGTYYLSSASAVQNNGALGTYKLTITQQNNIPVAGNDTAATRPGLPVTINIGLNDSDADNDQLTTTGLTNPSQGTVSYTDNSISADTVTYTPSRSATGTDRFTYQVSDGNGGTDTATVSVTINTGSLPGSNFSFLPSVPNNITGTVGDDTFFGTSRKDDIVNFSSLGTLSFNASDFTVREEGKNVIISNDTWGTDTLNGIEFFNFNDGQKQLSDLLNPENIDRGIYRFFNVDTGTHFLSGSTVERDSVINNLDAFNFEGPTFKAADPASPAADSVFRFFNTQTGTHFFTQSTIERDSILENLPQFSFENEAYKGYTEQVDGSIPLYRFFNTQTGTHFYTAAEAEKDSIIANLPSFNFEGTAYWVDPVMG